MNQDTRSTPRVLPGAAIPSDIAGSGNPAGAGPLRTGEHLILSQAVSFIQGTILADVAKHRMRMELPPVELAVVDELREIAGGDDGFVRDLIEVFVREMAEGFVTFQTALAAGQAREIAQCAHHLVTTVGSLGATRVADLLRRIDAQARHGDLSDLSAMLETLQTEFASARAALDAYLVEHPGA